MSEDRWAGRHHHSEWRLEEVEAERVRIQRKLSELEASYRRGEMDPLQYQDRREKLLEKLS